MGGSPDKVDGALEQGAQLSRVHKAAEVLVLVNGGQRDEVAPLTKARQIKIMLF